MEKIGILTFHRSINYGAFMQAYALSNALKKNLPGYHIEIIDYETEAARNHYSTNIVQRVRFESNINKKVRILIKLLVKPELIVNQKHINQAFEHCYDYLPLSKEKLITDDIKKACEWLSNRYDIIIVGSDCVWETMGYPFPNVYFLDNVKCKTKLSYAATVDRLFYPNISVQKREYIRQALSNFSYLGVRDRASELFLNACGLKYQHNCDPTFLIDISSLPYSLERIKKIFQEHGISSKEKIIGVMTNDRCCNLIKQRLGDKYKIVSIFSKCKSADLFLNDLNPFEWARVFSLFSVTVSSYFHGAMLSIMNGVPVISFDNWYSLSHEHITKIDDLFRRLQIEENYFHSKDLENEEYITQFISKIEDSIMNPNGKILECAIKAEQSTFYEFLKKLKEEIYKIGE